MKIKMFAFFTIFILIVSCATKSNQGFTKKEIFSTWTGNFESDFHTDGKIISWILYKDGTMKGTWETKKGSSAINVEGFYKIDNNDVSFEGSGTLTIYNNIKTKVKISGNGILNQNNAKGNFHLVIEHPEYQDDDGRWFLKRL